MTEKRRNIKRIIIIGIFIVLNGLVLSGIGRLITYFNTGADRNTALHIELKQNSYYLPKIEWKPLNNAGRRLNKQIISDLEKDYRNAWYVKNYALSKNDREAFDDFYTDSAKMHMQRTIDLNTTNNTTIKRTSLKHLLEAHFFSDDGQLFYFTDHEVVVQEAIFKNKKRVHQYETVSSYDIVMLLEDGFWRIRHFVKRSPDSLTIEPKSNYSPKKYKPFKGINYYSQHNPWTSFWDSLSTDTLHKDFKLIKKLNLNAIRIFIPYEGFGKENVDYKKVEKVKQLLDIAHEHDLGVIVTFFDFFSNYDIFNYTLCDRHLEQILPLIKEHPAIWQYDLKNEADLDFKNGDKETVLAWLKFIAGRFKHHDPDTPITVGWSTPDEAHLLEDKLDIVSFHYYKPVNQFDKAVIELQQKTNKPLVLQEFGTHSYNSFWFPFSKTLETQEKLYHDFQVHFQQFPNLSYVNWTLYDFPEIDSETFGMLPWRVKPQKNFGIIDVNGQMKPAAKHLTSLQPLSYSVKSKITKFHYFFVISLVIFMSLVYIKRKFIYTFLTSKRKFILTKLLTRKFK